MSASTAIPGQDKLSNPSFTVLVNGVDITMRYGIVSVMVSKKVNRVPVAEIVFYDGSSAKQDFELANKADFIPGSDVVIKAGYAQNEATVFKGIVTRFSIKAPLRAASTLHLEARDKSVKMTINRKNKYFVEQTDSSIIEQILGTYSLGGTVDTTTTTHKEMVQYYATDWDFIASRADVNSLLVFANDGVVDVKKPSFEALPNSLNLVYGDNIVDIEAEMDARDQYGSVTAKDWDYSTQAVIPQEGSAPELTQEEGNISGAELSGVLGVSDFLLQTPGTLQNSELTAWASAKLLRSRMAKIKGRVRIYGTNGIKPGDVIQLGGIGDRFNGPAFVSSVTHSYTALSTWYTDIHFGYSQEWFYERYENMTDAPASGLLPAVNGLVTGIVTDILDQEGGEFRVKVRMPLVDSESEGTWARIATLDAGPERGIVIRPENNDEVIMGFVNDDPRDAVILGMLHSKVNAVPSDLTPAEGNAKKGWVTKSKIKILLDDEKKTITIETPGMNSIVIDDDKQSITLKDQNNNSIVMDSKGITLDTEKDLTFKAMGKINVKGTDNVTLESQAQMKASGNSGAELSTSGQAVLKGSIVKIN